MKYRRQKLFDISVSLTILTTILSGVVSIPFSTRAIAQVAQSDDAKSNGLSKAKEVTQGFFDSLIAEEFERAREYLSPDIREYLSASDLEQQWQKTVDNMGSFVKYREIRPTEIFDNYYVLLTANFENLISDFTVTLNGQQQITTVNFLLIGKIQSNAEEFVDAISNGKYAVARGYLAAELKKTLLPEDLEQRWQEVEATAGPFKSRTGSKVVESSNSDAVLVDLEFEGEDRSFLIIFNPLSQIVGVDFPQSLE
jgi:hypothetical protein